MVPVERYDPLLPEGLIDVSTATLIARRAGFVAVWEFEDHIRIRRAEEGADLDVINLWDSAAGEMRTDFTYEGLVAELDAWLVGTGAVKVPEHI